jgi:hypothetical protein
MRRTTVLSLLFLASVTAVPTLAEAQSRRQYGVQYRAPMILNVRPRSFLNPGTVVQPGELNRTTSGFAQTQAYLLSPPYAPNRERFSQGVLPDPITNGPFVGARNPFAPVDFRAPDSLR